MINRVKQLYGNDGLVGVVNGINRYRYYHLANLSEPLSHLFYRHKSKEQNPLNSDWKICIILDACRYDLYKEVVGDVPYRYSPASSTNKFIETCITKDYSNTVYVTGNPMYKTVDYSGTFHHIIDVWKDDFDDQWGVVLPDAMVNATLKAYRDYPNKRILSHFIQPHYPFLTAGLEQSGMGDDKRPKIWRYLADGDVSLNEFWRWYRDNLEIVLPYVDEVANEVDGEVVVTSDHGNMIGERAYPIFGAKQYEHPQGIAHENLRKVPWHVIHE